MWVVCVRAWVMRFRCVAWLVPLFLSLGLFASCSSFFEEESSQGVDGEGGTIETLIGTDSELIFRGLDMNQSHLKVFRVTVGERDKEGIQTYKMAVESPDKGTQSVYMLRLTRGMDDSQKRAYGAYDPSGKDYLGFYLVEKEVLTAQLDVGETKALYLARRREDVSLNGQYVSLTILEGDSAVFDLGFDFLRIEEETLYSYSGEEDPFSLPYKDIYQRVNMTPFMKFESNKVDHRTDITLTYDIEYSESFKREAFGLLEAILLAPEGPIVRFAQSIGDFYLSGELDRYRRASGIELDVLLGQKISEFRQKVRQPDAYSFSHMLDLYRSVERTNPGLKTLIERALSFSTHSLAETITFELELIGNSLNKLEEDISGPWVMRGFVAMEGLLVLPPQWQQQQNDALVGVDKLFLVKVSGELSLVDGRYVLSNSDIFPDEHLEISVMGDRLSAKVMPDGYSFFSSELMRDTQGEDLMPASLRFFRNTDITAALFSLTDNSLMMLVETEKTDENGERETSYSYGVGVRKF